MACCTNDHNHNDDMNKNNNDNKNNDSRAMWGMMILCLLPLVLLFFGAKLEPPYSWIIFILAVIFMFGHHFSFLNRKDRDHSGGENPKENDNKQSAAPGAQNSKHHAHEEHKKHGSCCG